MGHVDKDGEFLSHATAVSPGLYAHNPEYFSHFKPRINKNSRIADDASIQCQIDLSGKENIGKVTGCLNPVAGGAAALALPFTSPENIALVAYMAEAAAIYDDVEETWFENPQEENNSQAQSTHEVVATLEQSISERTEQAVAKVMVHLSNQGQRGEILFSQWNLSNRITQTVTGESTHVEYEGLEQYFSRRFEDFGLKNLIALSYYGVDLTLTAAEELIVSPILQPLLSSIILTNDYFSWEKESSEAKPRLMSAVALFMKWQSCSAAEAKDVVKTKIIELEGDYLAQKTAYLQKTGSGDPSPSVRRTFELVEAMAAGLFLFDMTSPRYHCPSDNVYQAHLENRTKDRYLFFDSCTDSEDLLRCRSLNGIVNGTNRMVIDHSTRKNGAVNDVGQMPSAFINLALKPLGHDVLRFPSNYIISMPGKGVRGAVLNAMNLWYQVPRETLDKIKEVVKAVHTSSLMFDDVQDNSPLRRGKPAAHMAFGVGQTISSGFFLCLDGFRLIHTMAPEAMTIYIDELDSMYRGQAHDLYWTNNGICPTEEEYLSMIDAKTSALFRLASRLSRVEATKNKSLELEQHFTLVGRYFQIRDDYQNLTSTEYIDNKGFCEDLDEGKYSVLLIHSLQKGDHVIPAILQQRKITGSLTKEMKLLVLERLRVNGSFDYTLRIMEDLFALIQVGLEALERETKTKNWILRRVLHQLRV